METQLSSGKFKNKIERMLHAADAKETPSAAGGVMQNNRYHDPYQKLAIHILKHFVEPRMEMVADRFDDASLDVDADIGYSRLSFLHPELPAAFYLLFYFRLDHGARAVRLYAESCLRPCSFSHKPYACLLIPLAGRNFRKVEAFIEVQIVEFLKAYLKTRS